MKKTVFTLGDNISKDVWEKLLSKFVHRKSDVKSSHSSLQPGNSKSKEEISRSFRLKDREKRDLVIGFDLGTACTKVVIQDPDIRLAHAIPLSNESDPLRKYLLPTEIRFSPKDGFSLERSTKNTFVRHLKLLLMEKPYENIQISDSPRKESSGLEITAAYVALVLRKARNWFMKEHAKMYEGYNINWQMNVGIPSKNYDDKETKTNFEKMAIGAWWLSVQDSPITQVKTADMKRLVCNPDFQPGIPRDEINVVPEVVAQVAGYARSQLREEGLHMLVDIGASTLDTAIFLLNKKEGADRYIFLAARIGRLGSLELHYHRIDKVGDYLVKWIRECKNCFDILNPIPDFPSGYKPEFDNLSSIDEEFLQEVCTPVRWAVAITKTKKDPNSEKFVEGLPIFLCGGGSQIEFYNPRMLKRVEDQLHKNFKWRGFKASTIPKPENLKAEGLRSRDYHRLSVAYGLSFRYDDIGMIVPSSEVDDVERPKLNREYEFISKDQV